MASRRVIAKIRVVIPAGGAKPAPPVGPALGQAGLNIMNFCKDFNARTANLQDGIPTPTVITAYEDKSFDYIISTPPVSYFLKQAAGLESGSSKPGHSVAGRVSLKHVYEIAKVKHADSTLSYMDLKTVCSHIIGSAKSMGIKVVPKPEDM